MLAGHTVVYGGSFNPPHMAHQMACLYLLEALAAERVWLMPAFSHPFGKQLAPYDKRLEMCRLLAAPFGGRVEVSRLEEEARTGRTHDVLTLARSRWPSLKLALAIGGDIVRETSAWHRWSDIEAMVPVVVLARAGFTAPGASALALPQVSSTEVRERLARGAPVEGLVPASVAAYVARQGLFR
jgi:nicotinate-nucleotide adenylyltransferase